MLPRDFFTYSLNDLTDDHNLWYCWPISTKAILSFPKNFLNFRSYTIEENGIINLCSNSSKNYATVVLRDFEVTFLGECRLSSISPLCFVYTHRCIIDEVCSHIFLFSILCGVICRGLQLFCFQFFRLCIKIFCKLFKFDVEFPLYRIAVWNPKIKLKLKRYLSLLSFLPSVIHLQPSTEIECRLSVTFIVTVSLFFRHAQLQLPVRGFWGNATFRIYFILFLFLLFTVHTRLLLLYEQQKVFIFVFWSMLFRSLIMWIKLVSYSCWLVDYLYKKRVSIK